MFSFVLEEHQFRVLVKLNREDNIRKNCNVVKTYNL